MEHLFYVDKKWYNAGCQNHFNTLRHSFFKALRGLESFSMLTRHLDNWFLVTNLEVCRSYFVWNNFIFFCVKTNANDHINLFNFAMFSKLRILKQHDSRFCFYPVLRIVQHKNLKSSNAKATNRNLISKKRWFPVTRACSVCTQKMITRNF